MAKTPRPTPVASANGSPAFVSLAALAEIASRLASGEPLGEIVSGILAAARAAVHATGCSLWVPGPDGPVRGWASGDDGATAPTILAGMREEPGEAGLLVVSLDSGGRHAGALAVRPSRPLLPEESLFVDTLANLLAPFLTTIEHSRRLEVEVALRTTQIEEQRRFMERIVDSLPVGLYVVDREYRIHAWNRKRETGMQGISRDDALGKTIFEVLHRQPAAMLRAEFDEVFSTGRIQQFQMESSATGELRTYRISKIPMRVDDAPIKYVITIGEDITDWREAMDRFSQAEKLAAIGQLAAGVMHEINNPLATIAACAESLTLRVDDMKSLGYAIAPEFTEYLKIVDSEVHRCKRIVDGLLEFSRPRSAVKSLLSVNTVIEKALFLLKHHSRFKKLTVHTLLDPTLSGTLGSEDQLIQVFMSLLLNAADAMRERGTVTLRTRAGRDDREGVIAEVIDEGDGIARTDLPKIFEPFYTTKPPGRGTGLGLSICYGIVADHQGRIEVESSVGKGATFRIIFPGVPAT